MQRPDRRVNTSNTTTPVIDAKAKDLVTNVIEEQGPDTIEDESIEEALVVPEVNEHSSEEEILNSGLSEDEILTLLMAKEDLERNIVQEGVSEAPESTIVPEVVETPSPVAKVAPKASEGPMTVIVDEAATTQAVINTVIAKMDSVVNTDGLFSLEDLGINEIKMEGSNEVLYLETFSEAYITVIDTDDKADTVTFSIAVNEEVIGVTVSNVLNLTVDTKFKVCYGICSNAVSIVSGTYEEMLAVFNTIAEEEPNKLIEKNTYIITPKEAAELMTTSEFDELKDNSVKAIAITALYFRLLLADLEEAKAAYLSHTLIPSTSHDSYHIRVKHNVQEFA